MVSWNGDWSKVCGGMLLFRGGEKRGGRIEKERRQCLCLDEEKTDRAQINKPPFSDSMGKNQ